MKKIGIILMAIVMAVVAAGTAGAESIKGKFGITGQAGFLIPVDSRLSGQAAAAGGLATDVLEGDAAFAGGGGLIFGVTDIVALEAHVIHIPSLDFTNAGANVLEVATTDVSLGVQVRNNAAENMAAYLGAGVDVLLSDVEDASGNEGDIDTVVGGHVNIGGDYFITQRLALNLDLRGLLFPEADIKGAGGTVARYDPISFIGLFGVRYFLN